MRACRSCPIPARPRSERFETLVFPSLSDFAANRPSQATFTPALATALVRGWTYSAYLQDDIRATGRLTVNVGLRYDYTPPYTDAAVPNVVMQT